tara:strand:+ start:2183 stop:3046 length:864 start_codon:yes stop_codon:yes gene_type:complete
MNHISTIRQLPERIDEYDFDIDTIPMAGTYDDDCATKLVKCHDRMMIVKKDTMEYLGNHSTAYRPVTNKQIIEPIWDMIRLRSQDIVPNIQILQGGQMMKATFTCRDVQIQDPQLHGYIAFRITVRNSYNGVWSVMITADGFRLWCENGCTSADKIANYMQKHNGKFYYNFGHIEHLIDEFRSNEQRYREWYNTSITEQDVESMFNKLTYTPRATVDGKYRNQRQYDNLMSLWNEYRATIGKNKWGLYNTVTDWISHPQEVKDKHKTTVERNSKLLSYMNRPNSMFQ